MLKGWGLPNNLWADAAQHFVYICNGCPRASFGGKSPNEAITGKRPHFSNIFTFGAPAWYWLKKEDRKGKLANPGTRGLFLGISENLDDHSTSPRCLRINTRTVKMVADVEVCPDDNEAVEKERGGEVLSQQ